MRRLNEKQYRAELTKINRENIYKQRNKILKEKKDVYKTKHKLPSTSKLIAIYLFVMLNILLTYSMVAMWVFRDLTYLGALITDVVAQILTYYVYAKKSTIENTKSGITYELAMMDKMHQISKDELDDNGIAG